jgi:argininosuccinate lyase
MLGDLTTLVATLKGLPSSYNKDLQDDKRVLFDAVDSLLLVLPAVAGALEECEFNTQRMRGALSTTMMATDLADYLVRKGVTFRDAHRAVGRLVRRCEEERCGLDALPLAAFTEAHASFEADVVDALSPARSVEWREVDGGTGPAAVHCSARKPRNARSSLRTVPKGVTAIDDSIAVTSRVLLYTRTKWNIPRACQFNFAHWSRLSHGYITLM